MDDFFPFIHKIKKKEYEPQPLYIEVIPPPLQSENEEDAKESPRVIVIDL